MTNCPVCGMKVDEKTAPSMEHEGKTYYFMNDGHRAMFKQDPVKFLKEKPQEGGHMNM